MNEVPNMVNLHVDDLSIVASQGSNLLAVCLENSIYIPNLCFIESFDRPTASCRLCFVEIEGMTSPVPACTIIVEPDLQVKTSTDAVRRLQRTALRLLLSVHDVDCKNCHANHHCELQNIARFLKVSLKPKPLPTTIPTAAYSAANAFMVVSASTINPLLASPAGESIP